MFGRHHTGLVLPPLEDLLEQEYLPVTLVLQGGLELCRLLAPDQADLWPDLATLARQGYALAGQAGSLEELDALWADPRVRRRRASAAFPRDLEHRLLRRALKEDPDLTKADYKALRRDATLVGEEEIPPLSTLSALPVCSNPAQMAGEALDFLAGLPTCLQAEAALQMSAQLLVGCFAALFLCLGYARALDPQEELTAILTNAFLEYDLLERVVGVTYPIYQRYYTGSTGGEELNREEYGMLVFFRSRPRLERPMRQLADQLDPLPLEQNQTVEQWLADTMGRAILLRHQEFLEMEDSDLRRCLLALLCRLEPRPGLAETCRVLSGLDDLTVRLKEGAFGRRMEEQRSRLLEGDFSEANRTYAAAHSLEQVENGLQFEDYLARLFAGLGYQVTPTQASGDHGVDLILSKNGIRYALQAKFYTGKVGNKAVQEVYSGMSIWGAAAAVAVTTSSFTPQAKRDAARLGVALIDGEELRRLIGLSGTAAGFAHRFQFVAGDEA